MEKLVKDLKKNRAVLEDAFENNTDIKSRVFKLANGVEAALFFMEGVGDQEAQRDLISLLMQVKIKKTENIAQYLKDYVIPVAGASETDRVDACIATILRGDSLLLVDGVSKAFELATAMWQARSIAEPPTSSVLRGPREGFTEDLKMNITQIRRRMQTTDLMTDRMTIGRYTQTEVAVIYLHNVADPEIVNNIKRRLGEINIDGILDVNYLAAYLEEHNQSMFPQSGTLEKPDVLVGKILEGRVAIMVNGSPIALTIPFLMFENIQQSEDYYIRPARASFIRVLRIIGMVLGILLPAVYVAVQIFHYTVIPLSYLYTMMNAVQGLPMTPLMEMLFVLIVFEILHEASFRMPRYVGMAMSVVGALVLGDTAVKAGLISSPSIMIVAISAIALYAIPEMVGQFKVLRMIFVVIAGISGLWGVTLAGMGLIVYLASMDTYGTPYLAPFAPYLKRDLEDGLSVGTADQMMRRPASLPNVNQLRRPKGKENPHGKR